jgi:hypothetical protein
MIQEVRSLLINDKDANQFFLMPSGFTEIKMSSVESQIHNALFGGSKSSMEYKCFVADSFFKLIYQSDEFRDLTRANFDNRFDISRSEIDSVMSPSYEIVSGSSTTFVDISGVQSTKEKSKFVYEFSRHSETEISVSSNISDEVSLVQLSEIEIYKGTRWITLPGSNAKVKFKFTPSHTTFVVIDGGMYNSEHSSELIGGIYDGLFDFQIESGGPNVRFLLVDGGMYNSEHSSELIGGIYDGLFDFQIESGGPLSTLQIPQDFWSSIRVNVPFSVKMSEIKKDIFSVSGLIDYVSGVGERYPEILEKFYDDGRPDRQLLSVLLSFCLSLKNKIKQ